MNVKKQAPNSPHKEIMTLISQKWKHTKEKENSIE